MPTPAEAIRELFTRATMESLNAGLSAGQVSHDNILAIHFVQGQPLAGGAEDQFRVLYRESGQPTR